MNIRVTKTTYSDKSKTISLLIDNMSVKITQKQMGIIIKGLNLTQSANFKGKEDNKAFESYK